MVDTVGQHVDRVSVDTCISADMSLLSSCGCHPSIVLYVERCVHDVYSRKRSPSVFGTVKSIFGSINTSF